MWGNSPIQIEINEEDYNQIISTYFQSRLWGYFTHAYNILFIDEDALREISDFLEFEFQDFVTPTQVYFLPSDIKIVAKELEERLSKDLHPALKNSEITGESISVKSLFADRFAYSLLLN